MRALQVHDKTTLQRQTAAPYLVLFAKGFAFLLGVWLVLDRLGWGCRAHLIIVLIIQQAILRVACSECSGLRLLLAVACACCRLAGGS